MRWGCFVVVFFLSLWKWALKVLQKRKGKKGICAAAKLVPHVWDGNWLTQRDGEGQGESRGERGWWRGRKRGLSLPPTILWKEKQECRGSHQETRRCLDKPCAYWSHSQHGHLQANKWWESAHKVDIFLNSAFWPCTTSSYSETTNRSNVAEKDKSFFECMYGLLVRQSVYFLQKMHSSDQTRVSGDCESAQQKLHPDVSQRSLVGGEKKEKLLKCPLMQTHA